MYASGITYTGVSASASAGALTGAIDGLSVRGTDAVLGQDPGQAGDPGQLIDRREIPLNFQGLEFTGNGSGVLSIEGNARAMLQYFRGLTGEQPAEVVTLQGQNPAPGDPFGNFWLTLDESFINPDGQRDAVLMWGYNQDGGGGPVVLNEAAIWWAMESHFQVMLNPQFEVHLQSAAKNGALNRHLSIRVAKADGQAQGFGELDSFFFQGTNSGTVYWGVDNTGRMDLLGAATAVSFANTNPAFGQLSFAFNADGSVAITDGSTGTNPTIQFTSPVNITNINPAFPSLDLVLANAPNVAALEIDGTVTGNCFVRVADITVSGFAIDRLQNLSATGTIANLCVVAIGTGECFYKTAFNNAGTFEGYSFGLDQVAGNLFKIGYGAGTPGSDLNILTMTPTQQTGLGGNTTPTAWLHLAAGTAAATTAPQKFTPGVILGTPEQGAVEFNTANLDLLFTKNATQEAFVIGNSGAAAPTLNAGAAPAARYGGNVNFLGDPDNWLQTTVGGTVYKIPLYL
jgi:hypothetical protein